MNVADEGFQTIGAEFDRPPQQHRDRSDRHLVGIGGQLHAERTADIRRDDTDMGQRQPELGREDIAHLVRHLMRMMDRQLPQARIEIGNDGARLERHAGLPPEHEIMLRPPRPHRGTPGRDRPPTKECSSPRLLALRAVDSGAPAAAAASMLAIGGQFFPVDLDELERVLGLCPRCRDDRDDGLALPDRFAARRADTAAASCGSAASASCVCHGLQTAARSSPVTTAITPGDCLAAAMSMRRMRACGWGLRRKATCPSIRHVDDHRCSGPCPRRAGWPRGAGRAAPDHATALSVMRSRIRARAGDRFDRIDDRVIAGATAVIARQGLADFRAARLAAPQQFGRGGQASRACNIRIAARCGRRTRAADRRWRRAPSAPRWSRPVLRPPAPPASGSFAPTGRRS